MTKIFDEYRSNTALLENRLRSIAPLKEGPELYARLLGLLDMTTLEGSDTDDKVRALCDQSRFSHIAPNLPEAAAVCVYPARVRTARKALEDSGIAVASVAGGFPSGQTSLRVRLDEIRWAVGEGAEEIDTVISRGKLLEGNRQEVFDELCAMKEACGNVHLKVILETGELSDIKMVRVASELSILAGADFIKTSTGKISPGAEPLLSLVMLDTIAEYQAKTGKAIGFKAAGGIRTAGQAVLFASLVTETLGPQWLHKHYFRIGASSLASDLLSRL
jgi:deoxyribose-phosphate aldolase